MDTISTLQTLREECLTSVDRILRKRLNWLLLLAPLAMMGKGGLLGGASCFVLAGLALIPLAEVSSDKHMLPLLPFVADLNRLMCSLFANLHTSHITS